MVHISTVPCGKTDFETSETAGASAVTRLVLRRSPEWHTRRWNWIWCHIEHKKVWHLRFHSRSTDGSVSLRLYTYILLQSCLWVTPLCSTFAIFSERYIVNAPLWESIFRLSVCLSVAVGLSRPIVRHLSCIYPSCRLLDQRSGSVVKKNKAKIFAKAYITAICASESFIEWWQIQWPWVTL